MQFERMLRPIFAAACVIWIIITIYLAVIKAPLQDVNYLSFAAFTVFAVIMELLSVRASEVDDTRVTPLIPSLWSFSAVFGPAYAILMGFSAILIARIVCWASYILVKKEEKRQIYPKLNHSLQSKSPRKTLPPLRKLLINTAKSISQNWKLRSLIEEFRSFADAVIKITLSVGAGGLIYLFSGGKLLASSANINYITEFIIPFISLAFTAILIQHILSLISFSIKHVETSEEEIGINLRLYIMENTWPILRTKLPFAVVSLMMAYLYAKIGVWGLLLSFMPMLALRDIFKRHIDEQSAYIHTITTLTTYMQHHHPYTKGHLQRVAKMAERLAKELKLPAKSIRRIGTAGFLHDIGKIAVNEEILDKPGKLTDEEWQIIKTHPVKGAEIIGHIENLADIALWIKYHHKWYNGAGYPSNGVEAYQTPLESSVISVVDAFDAMIDDRELTIDWQCDSCGYLPEDNSRPRECPNCGVLKVRFYREPLLIEDAVMELKRGAGSQFHPDVVSAFLNMLIKDGMIVDAV